MGKAQITQKQTVEHMERGHACMLCMGKGIMERGYAIAWASIRIA
jgi:hypothetical protein